MGTICEPRKPLAKKGFSKSQCADPGLFFSPVTRLSKKSSVVRKKVRISTVMALGTTAAAHVDSTERLREALPVPPRAIPEPEATAEAIVAIKASLAQEQERRSKKKESRSASGPQ